MPRRLAAWLPALALCGPLAAVAAKEPPPPTKPPAKKPAADNPAAPLLGDAKRGLKLFKSEGCKGCHTTKDYPGGLQGPDLSGAGFWGTARVRGYIVKPKRGSIMPAYKGAAKAVDDLTAYLGTQKQRKP
jgi:mono/diheme cytochrome c family protein